MSDQHSTTKLLNEILAHHATAPVDFIDHGETITCESRGFTRERRILEMYGYDVVENGTSVVITRPSEDTKNSIHKGFQQILNSLYIEPHTEDDAYFITRCITYNKRTF